VNGDEPGDQAYPSLLIMVLVGGKDRTLVSFKALAELVGLRMQAAARQASGRFLIECRAQ
jgi:hypothetical protein